MIIKEENKAKSFKEFIKRIVESVKHFPEWKVDSKDGLKTTSVKLDILYDKYREFCTKEGYKSAIIEKQKEIMKEFNLKIIYRMDQSTQAYTNLRWKSEEEKLDSIQNEGGAEVETGENANNSVLKFLNSECASTSFVSDYIAISDLRSHYEQFCTSKKIDKLMKINIVGCIELEEFGAKLNQNMMIPYMSGLTLTRITHKDKDLIPDIVRIPKLQGTGKWSKVSSPKINGRLWPLIFGRSGLWTNFRLVLAHFLMLFMVPLPIFFAVVWGLQEVKIIDDDIYASSYTIQDLFLASKYEFWYDNLTLPYFFLGIVGLTGAFLISGCIELISFYATSEKDTGKYEVKYSITKHISIIIFWVMLTTYIALYSAYLSVVLAWWILGAIIDPQKFLPIATGAGVFVVFTTSILGRLKQINKSLMEAVSMGVDEGIKMVIDKATGGKVDNANNLLNGGFKDMTNKTFHTALNVFLSKNSYSAISMESSNAILQGDMSELVKLMHNCWGIDESVALALLGFLKNDNSIILESVYKISKELKSNSELALILCEIILDKYNPSDAGVNSVNGKTILTIKKLFKKVFPSFPLEAIEMILQIILENDPRPLKSILEELNIPIILYDIVEALSTHEENKIHDYLRPLAYEIMPQPYPEIFDALYSIYKGDVIQNLDVLALLIDFKPKFLLTMIVAMLKGDDDSTQHALKQSVYGIWTLAQRPGIESKDVEQAINWLLSLHLLNKKLDIDILKYIEEYSIKVNLKMTTTFYNACKGSPNEISAICDELGITNKSLILEFWNLWLGRLTKVSALASKLKVFPDDAEKLYAALKFTITTISFFSNSKLPKFPTLDERIMTAVVERNVERDLKEWIRELYTSKLFPMSEAIDKLTIAIDKKVDKLFKSISKQKLSIVDETINTALQNLGIELDATRDFKALWNIIVMFIDSIPFKQMQTDDNLEAASKRTIDLLDMYDEDQLEFILDMLSCNPYRIFGCETPSPTFNLQEKDIKGKFRQHRVIVLSEILKWSKAAIMQLSAFWINSYQHVIRGEQSFIYLAKEALTINPLFIDLIFNAKSNKFENVLEFDSGKAKKLAIGFMQDEIWRLKQIKNIKRTHIKQEKKRKKKDGPAPKVDESFLQVVHECDEDDALNCVISNILTK